MAERPLAGGVHARLLELGLFDGTRRVVTRGPEVLLPVQAMDGPEGRAALEALGPVVEADLPPRDPRPPMERVRRRLRTLGWSDAEVAAAPRAFSLLGDVALLRLNAPLRDATAFARALAEALPARAVLEDRGIDGPARTPVTRLLWGDGETTTVHVERGVRFVLDPARVMFSAGNVTERGRLLSEAAPGETVVDLFAGVGYFTLPLAVHAGVTVHACEINPVAAGFLREGVRENGVEGRVVVHEGDARVVAPGGVADRVVMGYFHGTLGFVPTALRALRGGHGVLHVHEAVPAEVGPAGFAAKAQAAIEAAGAKARTLACRRVKTYAPRLEHVVADMEVVPG